jgi:hypothetical protein
MTMTDNDDPAPPTDPPSSEGGDTKRAREGATPTDQNRVIRWVGSGGASVHIAPTDPEVPSAKRRGALRRQRSLVGLTAVIMGLLTTTLVLLYRASLRVGTHDDRLPSLHDSRSETLASPYDVARESALTRVAPPSPAHADGDLGDDAPASSDNAPAGSASSFPKGPQPAKGIIRTPAF